MKRTLIATLLFCLFAMPLIAQDTQTIQPFNASYNIDIPADWVTEELTEDSIILASSQQVLDDANDNVFPAEGDLAIAVFGADTVANQMFDEDITDPIVRVQTMRDILLGSFEDFELIGEIGGDTIVSGIYQNTDGVTSHIAMIPLGEEWVGVAAYYHGDSMLAEDIINSIRLPGEIVNETETGDETSEDTTIEDDNRVEVESGLFSVAVPEGWVADNFDESTLVVGSSRAVIDNILIPEFPSDDEAVIVLFDPFFIGDLMDDENIEDVEGLIDFIAGFTSFGNEDYGEPQDGFFNDHPQRVLTTSDGSLTQSITAVPFVPSYVVAVAWYEEEPAAVANILNSIQGPSEGSAEDSAETSGGARVMAAPDGSFALDVPTGWEFDIANEGIGVLSNNQDALQNWLEDIYPTGEDVVILVAGNQAIEALQEETETSTIQELPAVIVSAVESEGHTFAPLQPPGGASQIFAPYQNADGVLMDITLREIEPDNWVAFVVWYEQTDPIVMDIFNSIRPGDQTVDEAA